MKKEIRHELHEKALEVAELYSRKDRDRNFAGETFTIFEEKPLSEYSAIVMYQKDSGKIALACFFYIAVGTGKWMYFFPTDSHLLGMLKMPDEKQRVEERNFRVG